MSTFRGPLQEFPGVSVDQFEGVNRESVLFFLSHCHTDHMRGLEIAEPLPGPLYVSEISAVILRKRYPHLHDIRVLEIGVETAIRVNGEEVHVTTLPAGHCPGSVMLLFESPKIRVLYTGDFRLRLKDIENLRVLQGIRGNVDIVYLDSTFLRRDYAMFPSRVNSTNEIIRYIEEWIRQSPDHVVSLKTPGRYGQEYLFKEIHRRTGRSLHVDVTNLSNYAHIPDMDGVVTIDGSKCQIHACWEFCHCLKGGTKKIRTIKPTAMIWKNYKLSDGISQQISETFVRVCYSSHSSYEEIRDFILFLRPQRVELNVIPDAVDARAEMFRLLREILSECQSGIPEGSAVSARGETVYCPPENVQEVKEISFKNIKFRGVKKNVDFDELSGNIERIPKRKKTTQTT
ncbi:protein artemis [Sergentomyia squamirostris]